jgi:hypothetical protein
MAAARSALAVLQGIEKSIREYLGLQARAGMALHLASVPDLLLGS